MPASVWLLWSQAAAPFRAACERCREGWRRQPRLRGASSSAPGSPAPPLPFISPGADWELLREQARERGPTRSVGSRGRGTRSAREREARLARAIGAVLRPRGLKPVDELTAQAVADRARHAIAPFLKGGFAPAVGRSAKGCVRAAQRAGSRSHRAARARKQPGDGARRCTPHLGRRRPSRAHSRHARCLPAGIRHRARSGTQPGP